MQWLTDIERRWRQHYNVIPVDAETWARARIYNLWFDHGALRLFWTNQMEIAPGVFRSNHPGPGRLARLKAQGLVSVLSLRGSVAAAHNETEKAYCADLGLDFHAIGLSDKAAPRKETLLRCIDLLRQIERPMLLHCKSGADRAGLISAIYLMVCDGKSLDDAARMLSPRFLHFRQSRAGELDRVLAGFRRDGAGRSFEDYLHTTYDPETLPPR